MFGEFEDKWDVAYLFISWSWRRIWPRIAPFFAYPPEIWKVIYTTNAFELVLMSLRKEWRLIPERWGVDETVLPGALQHQPETAYADSGLDGRTARFTIQFKTG